MGNKADKDIYIYIKSTNPSKSKKWMWVNYRKLNPSVKKIMGINYI